MANKNIAPKKETSLVDPVEQIEKPVQNTEVEDNQQNEDQSPEENFSNESEVEETEHTETEEKGLFLVIPYLKSAASGEELKYALRSWDKFFSPEKVIIVGDSEDFFSDNVVHIEHNPESTNPQIDVAQKLLLVIGSGEVGDNFILSNDDIFLLGKTSINDLLIEKAFGNLKDGTGKDGGVYHQNAQRTADLLKDNGLGIRRYGTHTPVILNAQDLADIIDIYECDAQGTLVTSLYFNTFSTSRPVQITGGKGDPILASVYRADVEPEILKEVFSKRKFMNVNDKGWKAVEPYLEKLFPDKSAFEK